jgi:hypothetical protein
MLPFCLRSLFNICVEKLLESTKDSGFIDVDNSFDQHMSRLKAYQHRNKDSGFINVDNSFNPD